MKNVEFDKILGIDYGDFYIGTAIFDKKTDFTYPYKTLNRKKSNVLRKSIRELIEIIEAENIDLVVIGYPINMDDTLGERVLKVKTFAKMLLNKIKNSFEKEIQIYFQDERLTTFEANEYLSNAGINNKDKRKYIDQVAAVLIIKDFLKNTNNRIKYENE